LFSILIKFCRGHLIPVMASIVCFCHITLLSSQSHSSYLLPDIVEIIAMGLILLYTSSQTCMPVYTMCKCKFLSPPIQCSTRNAGGLLRPLVLPILHILNIANITDMLCYSNAVMYNNW
jgi:hypothetical protein